MSARRRVRRVAAAIAVIAVGTAAAGTGVARAGDDRPDLPPPDRDEIAALFEADLAALGLRTTRAALQQLRTYDYDPNGRHLAVYVEPIDTMTDEQFVDNLLASARVFLPRVFKRWTALKSFDVCQEPPPAEGDEEEPPPVTQVQVTRKGSAGVKWRKVTLTELLDAAERAGADPTAGARQRLFVYTAPRLDAVPALVAARSAAAPSPDA